MIARYGKKGPYFHCLCFETLAVPLNPEIKLHPVVPEERAERDAPVLAANTGGLETPSQPVPDRCSEVSSPSLMQPLPS